MILYTQDDIEHMPDVSNWFYGIVRSRKYRIGIYEIIPTYGFSSIFHNDLKSPKNLWWIIRDCIKPRRKYLPRISDKEIIEREKSRDKEIKEAVPFDPDWFPNND